jgi:hypothetical protein
LLALTFLVLFASRQKEHEQRRKFEMRAIARQILLLATLLIALSSTAQSNAIKPRFSVVFDITHGNELLKQCTRSTPQNINGFWTLAKNDVDSLEKNFYKLSGYIFCVINSKELEYFAFQYLGITINNKRFIYINAFPTYYINDLIRSKKYHRIYPATVCDGDSSFWGVLYNREENNFGNLKFNKEG